jgi:hypothetical protein
MTTKGFLLIFCFLSFFQKTYAQSKMQISVLNACVDYMLEKENIELLYVLNPSIESFCKADFRRNYVNYKLPFDSLEFLRIRNSVPKRTRTLWPKLILKKTIKLNEYQYDSIKKVNGENFLKNYRLISKNNEHELKLYPCCRFSNPVFTKNKKYSIVRIFDYCSQSGSVTYKYFLLEEMKNKWIVIKEISGGTLCG